MERLTRCNIYQFRFIFISYTAHFLRKNNASVIIRFSVRHSVNIFIINNDNINRTTCNRIETFIKRRIDRNILTSEQRCL